MYTRFWLDNGESVKTVLRGVWRFEPIWNGSVQELRPVNGVHIMCLFVPHCTVCSDAVIVYEFYTIFGWPYLVSQAFVNACWSLLACLFNLSCISCSHLVGESWVSSVEYASGMPGRRSSCLLKIEESRRKKSSVCVFMYMPYTHIYVSKTWKVVVLLAMAKHHLPSI